MDLKPYTIVAEPVAVTIKDPVTGADTDIRIFVLSPDHPDVKAKVIEEMRSGVAPHDKTIAAALIDKRESMIGRMITGWENVSEGTKAIKYSPKACTDLLKKYQWIGEQVDKFCQNRENFFKGSDKA